ncbi:MAG: HAD family hydrolase [Clostridia bacterium]|nr:HAD family hydrolase [Clostridia bacterium]
MSSIIITDSIGFDLDGTLWNSLDATTAAWDETAREFGLPEPTYDEVKGVMGLNKRDLMNKLFPQIIEKEQDEFFATAAQKSDKILRQKGGILFDGLQETLEKLSKTHSLYIVSNCQEGYIETFLSFHKLGQYFCDYQCSGNRGFSKGQNIQNVINRNGFKSSVYLGDTQGDCDAAAEAGVPFIFAEYGFGKVNSYDYAIKNISELLNIIET